MQILEAKFQKCMSEKVGELRKTEAKPVKTAVILLYMFTEVKWPYYKHKADKILSAVSNHCNNPKGKQWFPPTESLETMFFSPVSFKTSTYLLFCLCVSARTSLHKQG